MVNDGHANDYLRLIPLFPLLGALISGIWLMFARKEWPRSIVILVACSAPIASFVVAFSQFLELATAKFPDGRFFIDNVYTWIGSHSFQAEMSFLFDPLSAVMVMVVTGVGSLIHIYSIGYMDDDHRDDKGFQRFFVYLNLFTFSMLMLVLGDNLLVLFVGWEGVGLCSYLLIGFWYLEDHNAMCGQKAFVVNRIGDFAFLIGIFILFWAFYQAGHPTIDFLEMKAHIGELTELTVPVPPWFATIGLAVPTWKLLTVAGLCFFVGACGKSAQLPLYVWLPDAMAGPTPVSALIHAATMVTAGVYMVCRMSFLYDHAPGALSTIAWVGGLTAFFAATIAITQKDIKKVLAYSTVSQLGYMFLAAGMASYSAAIFHLATHAFFKALLFLAAGSVILGMHHEQDMDKMGGLRRKMPMTHIVFLIGVLAIIGAPPLSGFFSKDEILLGAFLNHDVPGAKFLWGLALFTAGLTSFYMLRLYFRIFTGPTRASADVFSHVKEQPAVVVGPLVVLALLSVFAGGVMGFPDAYGQWLMSMPDSNSLRHFLSETVSTSEHHISLGQELGLAGLAVFVALVAAGLAAVLYFYRTELVPGLTKKLRHVHTVLLNKYYVDEFYHAVIIKPLIRMSDALLFRVVDQRIIDGAGVNGIAKLVRGIADNGIKFAQTGLAQTYVFVMLIGGVAFLAYLVGGI